MFCGTRMLTLFGAGTPTICSIVRFWTRSYGVAFLANCAQSWNCVPWSVWITRSSKSFPRSATATVGSRRPSPQLAPSWERVGRTPQQLEELPLSSSCSCSEKSVNISAHLRARPLPAGCTYGQSGRQRRPAELSHTHSSTHSLAGSLSHGLTHPPEHSHTTLVPTYTYACDSIPFSLCSSLAHCLLFDVTHCHCFWRVRFFVRSLEDIPVLTGQSMCWRSRDSSNDETEARQQVRDTHDRNCTGIRIVSER